MNSKREFQVAYYMVSLENYEFTLSEFAAELHQNNCSELFYSLDEVIDQVLDLKVGDSMYFQPNRDIPTTKGIIVRTR